MSVPIKKKRDVASVFPTQNSQLQPRRGFRIVEAAMYMGVSPWFIEEKIRAKELPALRLCRHYTILKEDMDAFLDVHRRAAA
jgi:excisionase family DNA binding protein